nr:transposase [Planococcus antarcticus]
MISEERKQAKKGKPVAISVRQKVIRILWDVEKEKHLERIDNLHSELLKTFPQIIELDELVHLFRELFKEKKVENLMDWLENPQLANFSFIQSFAKGILQDLNAVKLSIEKTWSNGPTEGQINRLKTIKRMMYGRAGFQVLRNRVLYQW